MKINRKHSFIYAACLGLVMANQSEAGSTRPVESDEVIDKVPSGKGWGEPMNPTDTPKRAPIGAAVSQNGINYHGGPVMGTKTAPNIYYIWYGNWTTNAWASNNTAMPILTNLARNIVSPYYNINTTYTDGNGVPVLNSVVFKKSVTDNYSQGTALTDAGVWNVVANALKNGSLPADSNGVYFVLTSSDVQETSGFCTKYCGWHTHGGIRLGKSSFDIKYSFVGNPDQQCASSCEEQKTSSPNGNTGADGMASVIMHELEETVTDPDLNAWYDANGNENADKCAWTFGTTFPDTNGSYYNMTLGGMQYLIQQNWVNANGGSCALSH